MGAVRITTTAVVSLLVSFAALGCNGYSTAYVTPRFVIEGSDPCQTLTLGWRYDPVELTGEVGRDQPIGRSPVEHEGVFEGGSCSYSSMQETDLRAGRWNITVEQTEPTPAPPLTLEFVLVNGPSTENNHVILTWVS